MAICSYDEEKEIVPFLDTVCPLRASRVINAPICDYEEEKKEIDPFLDTVCPFRASRVTKFIHLFIYVIEIHPGKEIFVKMENENST